MTASQFYEQVQEAYLAYYGRPADPQGLDNWSFRLENAGGDLSAIINAFGNSAESQALYGSTPGPAQIAAIYEQLFGREPDAAGLAFYEQGLVTGQYTLASIAMAIYNGATGSDLVQLQAKLAYADAFTMYLEKSLAAEGAYSGNVASQNARAAVQGVTDMASEAAAVTSLANTIAHIGNPPPTDVSGVPVTISATGTVTVTGNEYTQSVILTGGDYSVITDANFGTGKANSIESVSLTDTGVSGQYSYVTIRSDALQQLTLNGLKQGVYVEAAAGARAESVTVDGAGPGYVSSQGAWLEDNTVTQMNIHAVGADSQMYLEGTSLKSIVFDNDANFSLTQFVVNSALTSVTIEGHGDFAADMSNNATQASINASQSSGEITLTLAAGQTYTGGSGESVINITGGHVLTEVMVGQGAVTLGESLAHVTFNGNGNTLTANGTQASFSTDTTSSQTFVSTANLDVINGLHAGDVLAFATANASAAVGTSSNLAGVSGNVEFVHGAFNAVAQTFTVNASGQDTLVTYGTAGDFVSLVLVGVYQSHLPAALSNHALTLG